MSPPPTTGGGLGTALSVGARRTSMVMLGLWAATWAAETGFAMWVRHNVRMPPPE